MAVIIGSYCEHCRWRDLLETAAGFYRRDVLPVFIQTASKDLRKRSTQRVYRSIQIHHPIILPFQTQNFPISQILPSIDIWHLFGLISRISGLLYGFFSVSVFFLVFSYRFSFHFSFSVLGLLSLP